MSGYVDTTYRSLSSLLAAGHGVAAVYRSADAGCVMAVLRRVLPGAVLLLVFGFLWLVTWSEHQKIKQLESANTALIQQRDEARRILNNQQYTMQFFNTLSKAATDEKQRNTQASEAVRAEIRPVLAAEPAARVAVPAVAADRVRTAVSEIRAGAAGAAPR